MVSDAAVSCCSPGIGKLSTWYYFVLATRYTTVFKLGLFPNMTECIELATIGIRQTIEFHISIPFFRQVCR